MLTIAIDLVMRVATRSLDDHRGLLLGRLLHAPTETLQSIARLHHQEMPTSIAFLPEPLVLLLIITPARMAPWPALVLLALSIRVHADTATLGMLSASSPITSRVPSAYLAMLLCMQFLLGLLGIRLLLQRLHSWQGGSRKQPP
jgi:hypothetical protein